MITYEQYKRCINLGFPLLPTIEHNFSIYVNELDTHLLIDTKEEYNELVDAVNRRNWSRYKALVKKYYPAAIKKYLGMSSITFDLGHGYTHKIPIVYKMECSDDTPIASCEYYEGEERLIPIEIRIYPRIMVFPDRLIDCILAHEVSHGNRFLSGRARRINSDKNRRHEEFWTDRELKKILPAINEKYSNREERRKSLKLLSLMGRVSQAGIFSPLGQLWDRLFPFSDNSLFTSSNL